MPQRFIELFSSQEKLSDKWILLLIFLFPIAGPVVRHWNSSIFVLLSLTSLYFLFVKKDRKPLHKEEKIYLWTFFLFFCVFLVSTISNGYSWEKINVEGLGTEINFLLFIPIYLLIKEINSAKKVLFAGVILSIFVFFIFSLYEYFYIWPHVKPNMLRGAYSQLFLGQITAFTLLISYYSYKQWFNSKYHWLTIAPLITFLGLLIIGLSTVRLAYLTIFFGTFIIIVLHLDKMKSRLLAFALVMSIFTLIYYQVDSIRLQTDTAFTNLSTFFSKTANIHQRTNTSVGKRLEVWRSSQYIFKEHPLVGIGNGNYTSVIQKHIKQGYVTKHVQKMGHAHNTFVEVLISKGSIGLIILLMIFYFPVYIAWKNKEQSKENFLTLCTFATAISLMSIGESMLINKNNGISYLLIFTAILFSSMISEIKATNKNR